MADSCIHLDTRERERRDVTGDYLGIDADRLWADVMALAAITDPQHPYTRRSFSARFIEGRAWLARRFADAGLAVRTDEAGNLIGRRPGRTSSAAVVAVGSHSDTVPSGGRFDGIADLVACRHGGMTELEEAELTDGQGRALSAHKSRAYEGYAKRTYERALAATRKRHAHTLASAAQNTARTDIQNDGQNRIQNDKREDGRTAAKTMSFKD
jgi:hypothetical protein